MRRSGTTLGMLLAVVALVAQTAIAEETPAERAIPNAEAMEGLPVLATGNTAFALAFYRTLAAGEEGNLFSSPLSVSMALGMLAAGARGDTLAQMEATLRFGLAPERLHPAFNALDWLLERRQHLGEGWGEGFTLNRVNSIWGQTGHTFLDEFLDVLSSYYGAELQPADFAADPEGARVTINGWIEAATNERIRDLIQRGQIDAATVLVLVNAVYFNAPWAFPFDEDRTTPDPFTLPDGTTIDVPTMHQTEIHGYARGDEYVAVELDYNGHELSMVVVLPDEGAFERVEASFDGPSVSALFDRIAREHVILSLPRFTFEWGRLLNEPLVDLGMADAFDAARADFSGIDGSRDLFIGQVIHKAFVSVDEAGTEAAAATAIGMAGAGPSEPTYYEVRVDRPFLFFIREKETGSILFIGRVVDPQ